MNKAVKEVCTHITESSAAANAQMKMTYNKSYDKGKYEYQNANKE